MLEAFVKSLAYLLFAAVATYSHGAAACEGPNPSTIQEFMNGHSDRTIFLGTVVSTTPRWKRLLGWPAVSTIRVSKWYAGRKPHTMMTLPHRLAPVNAPHNPCPHFSNYFEARTGEQWLILGTPVGDVIDPDVLSMRAEAGRLPPAVLLQIEALRPAVPVNSH